MIQNPIFLAQLVCTLLLSDVRLSFPPHSSCDAFTSTHWEAEGFLQWRLLTGQDVISLQPGKSLWGTSPFSLSSCHTGGISDSPADSLAGAFIAIGSSVGSSTGAVSLVGSSIGAPPQWALL